MSHFFSSADLLRGALQRAGEITDGTSRYHALGLKYLNDIYFAILAGSNEFELELGEPWAWAREPKPIVITLEPAATYTVTLTNDSTTGTFSVGPDVSLKNQFFRVGQDPELYQIVAHEEEVTTFTLDGVFLGDSGDYDVSIMQLLYPIKKETEILRIIAPVQSYSIGLENDCPHIFGLDLNSFDIKFPSLEIKTGNPDYFTQFIDEDGYLTLKFNACVSERRRVEIPWIASPEELKDSEESVPIVPREFRTALEHGCSYHLMADKDDAKADRALAITKNKMMAMIKDNRKSLGYLNPKNRGFLQPRQDQIPRRNKFVGERDTN